MWSLPLFDVISPAIPKAHRQMLRITGTTSFRRNPTIKIKIVLLQIEICEIGLLGREQSLDNTLQHLSHANYSSLLIIVPNA